MAIVEEVNLFLALLHKYFSVRAFYGRLQAGGYRIEDSMYPRMIILDRLVHNAHRIEMRVVGCVRIGEVERIAFWS
jgi:hypothetical protein